MPARASRSGIGNASHPIEGGASGSAAIEKDDGTASCRISTKRGPIGQIERALNDIAQTHVRSVSELETGGGRFLWSAQGDRHRRDHVNGDCIGGVEAPVVGGHGRKSIIASNEIADGPRERVA